MAEPIGKTTHTEVIADPRLLLHISIFATKPGEVQDAKLAPDEAAVSANMGLNQSLTLSAQLDLIAIARQMLDDMEKGLMGGIDAAPGAKPVSA